MRRKHRGCHARRAVDDKSLNDATGAVLGVCDVNTRRRRATGSVGKQGSNGGGKVFYIVPRPM